MSYPTLSNLKTYRGVSGGDTTDDATLQWNLDAAKAFIERECNRVFVAATRTVLFAGRRPFVSADKLTLNVFQDLVSVTTLTNGDGVVITSGYYQLLPVSRGLTTAKPFCAIQLLDWSGYRFVPSTTGIGISVAGSWGYSAACPPDVFQAILDLASYYYKQRSSGQSGPVAVVNRGNAMASEAGEIPDSVLRVIEAYARTPV